MATSEPEQVLIAEEEADADGGVEEENQKTMSLSRKEKRKAMKKMKRKQLRKETAAKEREEDEKLINDPEERRRMELMEVEEAARREKEMKEFEEKEKAWIQAMEEKKKKEEIEREKKVLEEEDKQNQALQENECEDGDDWEYVEEGPAEIIWKGNEIIVRKKKVRVPKKSVDQLNKKEDADRPTSNPLPPQSAAFADFLSTPLASAQQLLENVAQQVPNFGTEQDKAHCPFHLKTGACRFGQHCSRAHFYPDKSCTLLMKNMYSGPGLAWEQDEGLECTDEEVERHFEEFYEDVHTELLKFGEIVNFKVCKNRSSHLRGNVYVHYKSLESAVVAYQSINSRYFAGKQVKCEFVNVTKWKVAICGEYMKSRLKTCSRGTTCNFIHCFRNPGGDYEWADWDKPPPKYWVKKMVSLFGYSDDSVHDKLMEREHSRMPGNTVTSDASRNSSRRSRSRAVEHMTHRRHDNETDLRKSSRRQRHRKDYHKRGDSSEDETVEGEKKYHQTKSRRSKGSSDEGWSSGERERFESHKSKSSKHQQKHVKTDCRDSRRYYTETDGDKDERRRHVSTEKCSGSYTETENYYTPDRKKRTRATDQIEESSDRKRDKTVHRRSKNEDFENPGNDVNEKYHSRTYDFDHEDEKERYHSDRRKRSRDQDELSTISYDQEEPKKKKKGNVESGQSDDLERDVTRRHSWRSSRSSKEIIETECSRNSNSYYDEGDGSRHNPDESIDEVSHWEPEKTLEKPRRHGKIVDDYESCMPDRYDGRGGSQALSPENVYREKIDKKRYKVGGKSSSSGKKSVERYDDRSSRGSSRSSCERH